MLGELVGLLGSVALWILALGLESRAMKAAVRTAPPEWRDHPELRDAYAEVLGPGRRRRTSWRHTYGPLAIGTAVAFVAIAFGEFDLWFVLVYGATLAILAAGSGHMRRRDGRDRFAVRHGLPISGGRRLLRVAYTGSVLLLWLGFYGIAAFAGALVAGLVT
jgi:hypothetical protein